MVTWNIFFILMILGNLNENQRRVHSEQSFFCHIATTITLMLLPSDPFPPTFGRIVGLHHSVNSLYWLNGTTWKLFNEFSFMYNFIGLTRPIP